jgi:hypothetical protein
VYTCSLVSVSCHHLANPSYTQHAHNSSIAQLRMRSTNKLKYILVLLLTPFSRERVTSSILFRNRCFNWFRIPLLGTLLDLCWRCVSFTEACFASSHLLTISVLIGSNTTSTWRCCACVQAQASLQVRDDVLACI